ncbi:MAG: leucyl/phenylalanyl-tRNA--protein transferase [Siphonobacter sp.]
MTTLTAEDLIYGYMNGIFPMADSDDTLYWYSPDPRAIIPIDTYKPAKSLRPILNRKTFEVKINTNFQGVMRGCARPRPDGEGTWISEEIIEAYTDLHRRGFAHSVEAYTDNGLAGGLYGVAIGGAFFGESMFFNEPNASKVAFHYLIEQLRKQQYFLLDTQFINDNVRRYGAIEIARADYMFRLRIALQQNCHFTDVEARHFSFYN